MAGTPDRRHDSVDNKLTPDQLDHILKKYNGEMRESPAQPKDELKLREGIKGDRDRLIVAEMGFPPATPLLNAIDSLRGEAEAKILAAPDARPQNGVGELYKSIRLPDQSNQPSASLYVQVQGPIVGKVVYQQIYPRNPDGTLTEHWSYFAGGEFTMDERLMGVDGTRSPGKTIATILHSDDPKNRQGKDITALLKTVTRLKTDISRITTRESKGL